MINKQKEFRSKSGRFILGHICETNIGTKIYLARRKFGQLFRSGHKSISGAMTDEVCGWVIDENTLFAMRAKGCVLIGVNCFDTHDIYYAPTKMWFDIRFYKPYHYDGVKNGAPKRLLYLQHFEHVNDASTLPIRSILAL